ncbi:MAG: PqqD family protein [Anaerolineae bacterium]
MEPSITLDNICAPSEDVVAREIEGELIIVPLAAGIGDMEDELYTLNETGKAIWGRLDGTRSLRQIANELAAEYSAPAADIERDVTGLVAELARRKMLVVK